MIAICDLGSFFAPAWFATHSGTRAYEITIDQLLDVTREFDRTVVCADHPQLLRRDWSADYKANREEKPADYIDALRAVEDRVRAWGVPLLREVGFEADDLCATLVEQAWEPVTIFGLDKDLYSLVSDSVVMQTRKGIIRAEDVEARLGVLPTQVRDWIALAGDAADNISGAPGCGPGRATAILQRYGTIDAAKDAARLRPTEFLALPGIGKNTLFNFQEWDPTLAVQLATLLTDAPVQLDNLWDDIERQAVEAEADDDPMPF